MGVEIIAAKGLELLHELIPTARVMGLLVNLTNPNVAEPQKRKVQSAARSLALEVHVLNAGSEDESKPSGKSGPGNDRGAGVAGVPDA